jgi:small subunit ribosomal protein MRP21
MELRRAADAILRSQGGPLSATLHPRSTIRWSSKAQLEYSHCSNRPAQRCLSTTSRKYALKNIPTTISAPPRSATTETSPSNPSSSSTSAQSPSSAIADLGATLGWTSGGNRRSAFPKRATGQFEKDLNGGTSATDLLHGLRLRQDARRGGVSSGSNIDVNRMLDLPSTPGSDSARGSLMLDIANSTMMHKTKRTPMNLGPSTGRTVTIGTTGIDVGRGFRMLEQACARNKVRADAMKQRFHERGGLKRKRLGRERWRRKFMAGFKATISRVKALKNQGW